MSHYLAIDIETSGPGLVKNRIVAFGACVVNVASVSVVDNGEFRKFTDFGDHSKGRPDGWEKRCYEEFWMNPKKRSDNQTPLAALMLLAANLSIVDEREMMHEFVVWAQSMWVRFPDLVVITDTAAFDTPFVNQALDQHTSVQSLVYLFGDTNYRPVRDVSSFHMGIGGKTPAQGLWGSERAALAALDIKEMPESVRVWDKTHDPLNDAKFIGLSAAFIANALEKHMMKKKQRIE